MNNAWRDWVNAAPSKEFTARRKLVVQSIVADHFTYKWVGYETALGYLQGSVSTLRTPETAPEQISRHAKICRDGGWKASNLRK